MARPTPPSLMSPWNVALASELRDRVIELITHLASVFANSRIARVMPALIEAAEHHPQVATFLHNYSASRRRTLVGLLREGVKLGELAADFDPELGALTLMLAPARPADRPACATFPLATEACG